MKKRRGPALRREAALKSANGGMKLCHWGGVSRDTLELAERLFGTAGRLRLAMDFPEENVKSYRRFRDEKQDVLRVTFQEGEHAIEVTAYASREEELLVYEVAADSLCLNLTAQFVPAEESAYRNYNLGGFYFEEQRQGRILIGKGELRTDGFPKADEDGIHIKNASRVGFRIYLKSERRKKEMRAAVQAMELQMRMNRYLARTDDISREELLKRQHI